MDNFLDIDKILAIKTLIFLAIALIGVLLHSIKKWLSDEVDSVWQWFASKPKRTVSGLLAVAGAAITAGLSHQLDTLTFTQLFMISFPVGYSVDSLVNRSSNSNKKLILKSI